MLSIRGRIIECLRDAARPLSYIAVSERIGRSIKYTSIVITQLHQGERIVKVGRVPGVRAPLSTYRPTAKGLQLLDPDYTAQKVGAKTRAANRLAAVPAESAPPVREMPAHANANIWDVW